jgi:hypothetical protein
MATITSVGSGAWGTAGTWDAGVPADGDDVIIASGHTVTFDVDQSAFTTGVKVTITGTLTHTTATGTYCLFIKTGASVVGAGTWNVGTSDAPIPFAAKHTITGAAGWYVDGVLGLTMTVYGAEPSVPYVKLSADEAVGQTELSIDTDITGDIWADGDIVRIDDINRAQETEERVIATSGIASGTITVTAGLTAAKSTGAIVSLISRNVKIIATGAPTRTICRVNNIAIASGMWYGVNKYMLDSCTAAIVSGGTFIGNLSGLQSCASATISGGTFSGNNSGLQSCASATISGGIFSGNTYDLRTTFGRLFDIELSSATEHYQYTSMPVIYDNCQSDNHDGIVGALKTWGKGGVVTSQGTVVPSGYSQAYTHELESAVYPCFWRKYFGVPAGTSLTIEVQLRKTASMTYLPRVYLMESIGNPLAGATPVDSFTMTGSVDTWETDTFSIDNSAGTYDKEYVLWFVGQNATGSVYSAYDFIPPTGGGGGAVKIVPLGGIRL